MSKYKVNAGINPCVASIQPGRNLWEGGTQLIKEWLVPKFLPFFLVRWCLNHRSLLYNTQKQWIRNKAIFYFIGVVSNYDGRQKGEERKRK